MSIGRNIFECRRKKDVDEEMFLSFADGIRRETGEGPTVLFVVDEDLKDFSLIVLDATMNTSNPFQREKKGFVNIHQVFLSIDWMSILSPFDSSRRLSECLTQQLNGVIILYLKKLFCFFVGDLGWN